MSQNVSSALNFAGRLLLALLFVLEGPPKILNASATAAFMASGGLPNFPALAVLVGLFELVVGFSLLAGVYTRWAAVALAVFTVAADLLFHAYWAAPADQQFIQELLFNKNMAVVGGLLVLVAMGPGPWSWDQRRSANTTSQSPYGA